MPAGRPRLIARPEEFKRLADAYFAEREQSEKPITVCGLALALGFSCRQSLYDYEGYPEFSDAVKAARLRVEDAYESNLHGAAAGGSIFALKNMGWTDRREIEHGGSVQFAEMSDDEIIRKAKQSANRIAALVGTNGSNGNGTNGNGNGRR